MTNFSRQEELVLGLDIGTSAVKVTAINYRGESVSTCEQGLTVRSPRPNWSEQDPRDWWEATSRALQEITSKVSPDLISAVGLTGQMHSPALLDETDNVIRPSILWNDGRTTPQCERLTMALGTETLTDAIGNRILEGFTAPKILWLKDNEKPNFDRLSSILIAKDYITFRLTGEKITEPSDASGTLMLDLRTETWSTKMLDALQVSKDMLPRIVESTSTAGYISKTAAKETGLTVSTPIVAGGADNAVSALSTGGVTSRTCQISIGTSGTVLLPNEHPNVDSSLKLHCFSHCIPRTWYSMGTILSAGNSLKWFREKILSNMYPISELDHAAQNTNAGSDDLIFLPYLNGERTPHNNPHARGIFFGLNTSHTYAHMTRSVMEGVAFALKESVNIINQSSESPSKYIVTGGGAKSNLWVDILSNVLEVPLYRTTSITGASYGAGMLAALNQRWFTSAKDITNLWVSSELSSIPNPDMKETYHASFDNYRTLYQKLSSMFKS